MNRALRRAAVPGGLLMLFVACTANSTGQQGPSGSDNPGGANTPGPGAGATGVAPGSSSGATTNAGGTANSGSGANGGTGGNGAGGTAGTPSSGAGANSGSASARGAGADGGTSGSGGNNSSDAAPSNDTVPPGWNADCGLQTSWNGDDRCINPPPPDLGFQVHVGPSDYSNPDPTYNMQPGDERTDDFQVTSPNQQDRYFYYRQYRMRPTAHHMILTASSAGGLSLSGGLGHRIATANRSGDYPVNGITAPENKGVGSPIGANSSIDVSLHAINSGSTPQLREIWVNFWYKDASQVTDPAVPWFDIGDATYSIPPGADYTIGPNTCTTSAAGRLLWLYGHRHANNVSFIVNRIRGGKTDLIYAGYHWDEPITLQYDSITQNAVADTTNDIEGGWSGILDLMPGDQIQWACHIINKQSVSLQFTNNTYTGEMCIVDAEAVGTNCL